MSSVNLSTFLMALQAVLAAHLLNCIMLVPLHSSSAFFFAMLFAVTRQIKLSVLVLIACFVITLVTLVATGGAISAVSFIRALVHGTDLKGLQLYMYSYVFLPCIWIGARLRVQALPYELTFLGAWHLPMLKPIVLALIHVLQRRDLITSRANELFEAVRGRGVPLDNGLMAILKLRYWVPNLVLTTLVAGIESYEYGVMQQLNLDEWSPARRPIIVTSGQILMILVCALLGVAIGGYVFCSS